MVHFYFLPNFTTEKDTFNCKTDAIAYDYLQNKKKQQQQYTDVFLENKEETNINNVFEKEIMFDIIDYRRLKSKFLSKRLDTKAHKSMFNVNAEKFVRFGMFNECKLVNRIHLI